jgi:starvation-inducible outer membrane lipoprotein
MLSLSKYVSWQVSPHVTIKNDAGPYEVPENGFYIGYEVITNV